MKVKSRSRSRPRPRILLVEDDPMDAMQIREELEPRGARVDVITTEQEFAESLPGIGKNPPDLIIIDVMLRWTKPRPGLTEDSIPKDVRDQGFYFAGLRCIDQLEQDPKTKAIPWIIYTGLDRNNFTKHVVHTKSNDFSTLVGEIRKIIDLDPNELPK